MIIAIPTGRLGNQTLNLLYEKKITETLIDPKRKLIVKDDHLNHTFIFVKPSDVITYVSSGYADLGIVGSDLIKESKQHIYALKDLNIGQCKMIVATLPNSDIMRKDIIKVATKFPNITKTYFDRIGKRIEVMYLNGSVELAPLLKVSDCIVDITETGTTLKENGLIISESIMDVSAYLISNKSSYVLKYETIQHMIQLLEV
jgi:ATP phosphoribosyltransferase